MNRWAIITRPFGSRHSSRPEAPPSERRGKCGNLVDHVPKLELGNGKKRLPAMPFLSKNSSELRQFRDLYFSGTGGTTYRGARVPLVNRQTLSTWTS